MISEIVCLRKANHPHVVRLWDVFETHLHVHLIFEYAYENSLSIVMKKNIFNEEDIYHFMYHFICTLKYLHDKKIVHENLNPDHILFFDKNFIDSFKICGFGCSTICNSSIPFNIRSVGEIFSAPELNLKSGFYGPNIDTFSMGKILEFLLSKGQANFKKIQSPKCRIYDESKLEFFEKTGKNMLQKKLNRMIFEFANPNKDNRPIPSLINLKEWFGDIEESESIVYRQLIEKHNIDSKTIESLKGIVPENICNKKTYMLNNIDQINYNQTPHNIPTSNKNCNFIYSSFNNIFELNNNNSNVGNMTPFPCCFSNNRINFSDFLEDIDGKKSPLKEYVFKIDEPLDNPIELNFDKESLIPNEDLYKKTLTFTFALYGASRGLLVNSNHLYKKNLK